METYSVIFKDKEGKQIPGDPVKVEAERYEIEEGTGDAVFYFGEKEVKRYKVGEWLSISHVEG